MSKTDVIVIHCSNCREKISAKDLFEGDAMSIGKYCFCRECASKDLSCIKNLVVSREDNKPIEKMIISERR